MDIAQGELGSRVNYELDVLEGKAILKVDVELLSFIEKAAKFVKEKIPGQYDDAIIDGFLALVKAALNQPEAPKPE